MGRSNPNRCPVDGSVTVMLGCLLLDVRVRLLRDPAYITSDLNGKGRPDGMLGVPSVVVGACWHSGVSDLGGDVRPVRSNAGQVVQGFA